MFLKETEYPHPRTALEKKHNKDNYEMAMAIRDKTALDLRNKELGLFNEDVLLGDFVDYFNRYANARKWQKKSFVENSVSLCNFAAQFKNHGKEKLPDYRIGLPPCQPEGRERGGNC